MRLYLSGPMSSVGPPDYNWPAFEAAAHTLRLRGHVVISPAEIDEEEGWVSVRRRAGNLPDVQPTGKATYADMLARDLEYIETCDGIVLLPQWTMSEGAGVELAHAVRHGLAVYYTVDDVPDPIRDDTWPSMHRVPLADRMAPERRITDPTTGGQKGQKLARFDLIPPDALHAVAEQYGVGARKYEDRNWELGYPWGLSYAALQRHLNAWWEGEEIDEESNTHHLAAAGFHVLSLLAFVLRDAGTDDRGLQ